MDAAVRLDLSLASSSHSSNNFLCLVANEPWMVLQTNRHDV